MRLTPIDLAIGTCGCSSVVERHVANVAVVGSSPITRSFFLSSSPMNHLSALFLFSATALVGCQKAELPTQEPQNKPAQKVTEAEVDAAIIRATSITLAIIAYAVDNDGALPPSLDVLLQSKDGKGPYVKSRDDLNDPWGNQYKFRKGKRLTPDVF